MTKENEMNFYVHDAILCFIVENCEGEEEEVDVQTSTGYELMEKLEWYYTKDYDKIFGENFHYAYLRYIKVIHEQDGVKFSFRLNGDDGAYGKLLFNTDALKDENEQKIAMIREVLDFDPEAETSLLREKFRNR